MSLEEKLENYRKNRIIIPRESQIVETVRKSREIFCNTEQEYHLTYLEFLWTQFHLIKKRWWFLQLLLLLLLWAVLPSIQIVQRALGIAASLFVILIIPELWKSQTSQAMEIEAVSYYSLRQIYAARMLLFGLVDILLLTLFCISVTITMGILFSQLLIQFLFPMTVTAAICFWILCCKHSFSETTAIMLCIAWSALWLVFSWDETRYAAIALPLWLTFLGIAFSFLIFAISQTLHHCNHYLEEKRNEFGIG